MNAIRKLTPIKLVKNHQPIVLVLGGYGFIGRHIVNELESLNIPVLIGTRRQTSMLSPQNERHIMLHKLTRINSWEKQLDGVDVVINAIGILRQRWDETYDQVHHLAVAKLANACAQRDIRLIHVSALGLNNDVKSRFLSSKLLGEHALAKSQADWHLVRPSLVDGEDGFGARWFRRVAKWPLHFIPSNARGKIAPVLASDLGKAIASIALRCETDLGKSPDRIYELGGQTMTLQSYLNVLRFKEKNDKAICIRVPAILCRALSHICDALHLTPLSFGHYELLKNDNIPQRNRLTELLNSWARIKYSTSQLMPINT